ncbi:hypothetical protein THAOC_11506 [Thalassiosira oceanica]|uniref:Uncharacterized protein n=1 Tax=Thalassiosira oceanica TaxID=159749 RepID=K0T2D6_THAOC|nr:hypothetical protein THAOC_11506 [Thalassiosira oceanica]|eukprot:EJK67456.1 hypothetical protein THAOC_11506 [Thalassiosira oceanica]
MHRMPISKAGRLDARPIPLVYGVGGMHCLWIRAHKGDSIWVASQASHPRRRRASNEVVEMAIHRLWATDFKGTQDVRPSPSMSTVYGMYHCLWIQGSRVMTFEGEDRSFFPAALGMVFAQNRSSS